jgi:uncharacterized protein (DUF2141 family)
MCAKDLQVVSTRLLQYIKFDVMSHLFSFKALLFGFFLNIPTLLLSQDLEVIVKNIKNGKGTLMIGLFNSEKTFKKEVWKGERPKAQAGELKVIFKDVPPGDYAVSVFHDENENGKIDMNFMGIPSEGFGFSNDAMGTFGPPSFEKAKVVIPAGKAITLTLKYIL